MTGCLLLLNWTASLYIPMESMKACYTETKTKESSGQAVRQKGEDVVVDWMNAECCGSSKGCAKFSTSSSIQPCVTFTSSRYAGFWMQPSCENPLTPEQSRCTCDGAV